MAKPKSSKAAAKTRASFGTLQQCDLVSSLALAVTGAGPAAAVLPSNLKAPVVGEGEDWSAAFASPSGWCIVLSQDCDLVSDDASEPTVEIGLVGFVDVAEYATLKSHKYFARYLTLPEDSVPGTPDGKQAVVDLAWRTSVLKLSLDDPKVGFVRILSEPQRRELADWLGRRSARVPFPDDLIEYVLDPFSVVLSEKAKSGDKKPVGSRTALERLVLSVPEWYVQQTELVISFIGTISIETLLRNGWSQEQIDGSVEYDALGVGRMTGELEKAREQLHTALQSRMNRLADSGYLAQVLLADLEGVPASTYRQWRRYVR